jgi:crotonobetainyl-CoA:carnitine CoA-transferase CaiB-like acyl-CoA transferase
MLSHLRVIDLCDGATAIAGRMLADLGAEVILIEPPGGVDSRHVGPYVDDVVDPERSLEFFANQRGKRSVVLDLGQTADRDRLLALADSADVWIDDGTLEEVDDRFGHDALLLAFPRLVRASITPFGSSGPKRDWAATDLTAAAASGALALTGDSDRAPLSCGVPQAFYHAGSEASAAIMLALAERQVSGLGQNVDVSAQTAMMQSTQSSILARGWSSTSSTRTAGGVAIGPYRVRFIYECLDGYVNFTFLFGEPIGHATTRFFDWMDEEGHLNDAIRNEDWVGYGAKIMTGGITVEAHEAVLEAIERFTRTKTKAEFLAAAFERRVLVVPLSDCKDLLASSQLESRDFWRPIKHPGIDREILHPGAFARMSATPLDTDRPAPRLGECDFGGVVESRTETTAPNTTTERRLPLEGLKVLDFTWVYAGPAITRQLADYGATVIKVESNSAHDALRSNGPFKDDQPGADRSANFSNVNLGKRSIGLNLKTPEARDVVLSLVDWADVVVENFSPKAMKAWDLDWEVLGARKPKLVMLSSSLAGGSGPEKMLAGYGTMGSAIAGFGFVTGWPDRRPAGPYVAYTDYVSPRFAISALLAAVDHARRTGVGQHIDVSQAEASIHFLGAAPLDYTANERIASAHGNRHPHYAPSGVYPVVGEDRWIALAAPDDDSFVALARVAGKDWATDPRFQTAASRIKNADALDEEIAGYTVSQDIDWLEAELQRAKVPAHRVHDSESAFDDPHLAAREHFVPVDYADLGPVPYENARGKLSATPAQLSPCPRLGEDNEYVLSEILHLDEAAITELIIAGAIE